MLHPAAGAAGAVDWSRVGSVLVTRSDNLGDLISLTPALRALRATLPQARIDVLASPAAAALGPLLADVDEVVSASLAWAQVGAEAVPVGPVRDLIEDLRARDYDALVISTSYSQSPLPPGMVGLLAGIPIRIGQSVEFGGGVLTHWYASPPPGTHQVDRNLQLLDSAGIPAVATRPELTIPKSAYRAVEAIPGWGAPRSGLPADGNGRVVLLPGASCSARRYPAERWRRVAGMLTDSGCDVLVLGTPGEANLVESVAAGSTAIPWRGFATPEMAAALKGADVAVANNSGGMWVAEAVGTPVVVLYGGTEYVSELAPRHTPATVLKRSTSCSPCRQFECPFALECLDVTPREVVSAVYRHLRQVSSPRSG